MELEPKTFFIRECLFLLASVLQELPTETQKQKYLKNRIVEVYGTINEIFDLRMPPLFSFDDSGNEDYDDEF